MPPQKETSAASAPRAQASVDGPSVMSTSPLLNSATPRTTTLNQRRLAARRSVTLSLAPCFLLALRRLSTPSKTPPAHPTDAVAPPATATHPHGLRSRGLHPARPH